MPILIPEQIHGKTTISGQGDTLTIAGEIDSPDPGEFLTPFFSLAKEQMEQVIKLDFSRLEFLNSSGIKCLVSFVL